MIQPKNIHAKIHMDDPLILTQLSKVLNNHYEQSNPDWQRPTIVLCIGTDRSTGDSLGPLVGTRLQNLSSDLFKVYGTLDSPVHANNLTEIVEEISHQYFSPFILAVDACLGRLDSVGCISIGPGPLHPGSGVNKNLPPVGDVNISGIVNVGGYMEFMVLQNTRLSVVMKLANLIARSIFYSTAKFAKHKSWWQPVKPEVFTHKDSIQTG
jgi:putative sporulation protein YyaC